MASTQLPPRWGLIEDLMYHKLISSDALIPMEWQEDVSKGVEECLRLQETLKQANITRHMILLSSRILGLPFVPLS
jgi:hypothetical protein